MTEELSRIDELQSSLTTDQMKMDVTAESALDTRALYLEENRELGQEFDPAASSKEFEAELSRARGNGMTNEELTSISNAYHSAEELTPQSEELVKTDILDKLREANDKADAGDKADLNNSAMEAESSLRAGIKRDCMDDKGLEQLKSELGLDSKETIMDKARENGSKGIYQKVMGIFGRGEDTRELAPGTETPIKPEPERNSAFVEHVDKEKGERHGAYVEKLMGLYKSSVLNTGVLSEIKATKASVEQAMDKMQDMTIGEAGKAVQDQINKLVPKIEKEGGSLNISAYGHEMKLTTEKDAKTGLFKVVAGVDGKKFDLKEVGMQFIKKVAEKAGFAVPGLREVKLAKKIIEEIIKKIKAAERKRENEITQQVGRA